MENDDTPQQSESDVDWNAAFEDDAFKRNLTHFLDQRERESSSPQDLMIKLLGIIIFGVIVVTIAVRMARPY